MTDRIHPDPSLLTLDDKWQLLLDMGVSEQTLSIVVCINGYSLETLEAILFAYCGYRNFQQYLEELNDD